AEYSDAHDRSLRWRTFTITDSDLAERRISGAGNFRSLWRSVRGPPGSAAPFDVGRICRSSDAQGLSRSGRLRIRTDAARRSARARKTALHRAATTGRRGKYRRPTMS